MKFLPVYDSDCGPCGRFKEIISFLDTRGRMDFMGLLEADREDLLDGVPVPRRHRSFHLLPPGGAAESGPSALPDLIALLPAGRILSKMIKLSTSLSSATNFVYSVFARRHDSGACTHAGADPSSTSISTSRRTRVGALGPVCRPKDGAHGPL